MALQSKTITADGAKKHHKFTLTVTENSTSTANNNSSVAWKLEISPIRNSYDWVSNQGKVKYSVMINGSTYSGIIAKYDGVSTVTIKSGTLSCPHDDDGTKTISFSFSITDSTGWSFAPGNASASGTMELTYIPRYAIITAAPDFNDEEDPTITYSNPFGTKVTALDACISLTGAVDDVKYRPVSTTGTSYTFALTEEEREVLRNGTKTSKTRSIIFYLRTTMDGVLYHSTSWKTLAIVNANPIIDPVITDTNGPTANLTDGTVLIRSHSNAYFETGAVGQKGATIKSQSVTCGGVTVEGATGTFPAVQSGDFVFTVTDSRGNTTTLPVKAPFVDYVNPTCSIIDSGRPDGDGNLTLKAAGVCFTGEIPGAGPNVVKVYYRHKESGGSYGDLVEMRVTAKDGQYTAVAGITGLDYQKTHIFQCVVEDFVASATTEEAAFKAIPVFDWSDEDFNFNVPVNAPGFSVGGVQMDYIVEQGTKSSWIYRKWNSGIMECWRRLQVTTAVSNAWGSMFVSGALSSTNLTYPYAFIETPILTVSLASFGSGGLVMASGNSYGSATTTGVLEIARGTSVSSGAQFLLNYHAIGKWK